ncbi:MAG: division/cell wall cluster transcriptional repressor MraZ [Pseudorhodoplanes sp.]|nr:division/cell wall cluster transcriptional repressor MraZ [Pseudorhodoplanes sp.]
MDRFYSQFILKLDAKGRVSIPAPFRAVLSRDGFEGPYCFLSPDRPALEAGGKALLSEIEQLVESFPQFSEEREQISTALYGTSEFLKMDGEGRVTLSDTLKDHAGIMDAVAFIGLGHKFQIWAPDQLGPQLSEATGLLRSLRKRVGTQHAAGKPQGARER